MNGNGYQQQQQQADPGVKSIVNKQYNTPVGIYSDESIAETLSAQAEVLAGGVLGWVKEMGGLRITGEDQENYNYNNNQSQRH